MSDRTPQYRFRGNVAPSAEVSRPAAAYRNASASTGSSASGTSATLDLFDVIDSFGGWWGISASDVAAALASIGDVDTIYVRINSPGGEATEGVAIANLLRAAKARVQVTVYGLAASAASVIAVAGDELSMAPGSTLMIHDASGFSMGFATDMRSAADMLDSVSDSYASLYAVKAGGDPADWRAAMQATTWYTAAKAVSAKLADRVGLDPQLPADLAPVEDDSEGDDTITVEIDVEISPAARAAARRFDLSMLPNTPAALAAVSQTPADSPVTTSTHTEEADNMSDTLLQGLRTQLGLPDDADEATVLAANAEALTERADAPPAATAPTETVKAVVDALKADGKAVVSQAFLDALKAQAEQGAEARAKQLGDARDEAIEAAMTAGKISRSAESRASWVKEFDRDAVTAQADLDALPARFPVAPPSGYSGHDGSLGESAEPWSDDEADALGALAGLPKGSLR